MFKEFFVKKMLQAKGIPGDQVDMVMALVNKDPDLFKKIAEEVQAKIAQGKDQMLAAQEVMMSHQSEIQALLTK